MARREIRPSRLHRRCAVAALVPAMVKGASRRDKGTPAHDRYRQRQLFRFPGEGQVPAAHHVQAEGTPGVRPRAGDRRRRPGLLRCLEPVGHGQASAAHRRGAGGAVRCAGPGELRAAARRGGAAAGRLGGQPCRRATARAYPVRRRSLAGLLQRARAGGWCTTSCSAVRPGATISRGSPGAAWTGTGGAASTWCWTRSAGSAPG